MRKLLFLGLFATQVALATVKVGVVFDRGGKDDKSFNQSAYRGLMKAKADHGVFVKYVEASDEGSFEPMLRAFAQKDFDLILAIGISQGEAIKKVAAAFPQKHFALVDAQVIAPNVRSILFEEQEGSYLVGAAAALASKSGKIGFIGGMDIPLIKRFFVGYQAGAKKINPKIQVSSNYVGVTMDAWNNPARAKELAVTQFDAGADVIFAAAGASGTGLFDAAEEKKKLAIGCDSNQNWIKPGRVLTSMIKSVDNAVFQTVQDQVQGKFTAGIVRLDLKSGGLDYAMDEHNAALITPQMKAKLEGLRAEIIAQKIKVPDFYKMK